MKITILKHYPADRNLAIGEASKVKMCDGKFTLMMPCPKCGVEMLLSDHNVIWHDEDTVTIEPSLVCNASKTYSAQILHNADNCMGHFFIRNNEIQDLA